MLSKSRGGEKVKQNFSAASHEPKVGGLHGDAVYADLGVLHDEAGRSALRILDRPLGDPLATTCLPPSQQGTCILGRLTVRAASLL